MNEPLPQFSIFANFCCQLSVYYTYPAQKMVSHVAVGC